MSDFLYFCTHKAPKKPNKWSQIDRSFDIARSLYKVLGVPAEVVLA